MMNIRKPPYRKLRGYAFDPSLSLKVDTALINDITYHVRWEDDLKPGPLGEYIEVIDYDPTVGKFYEPVDLNNQYILAQDGLDPSSSNPQFHQQMVYAVSMTTIKNFESALGRPVLWSPRRLTDEAQPPASYPTTVDQGLPREYVHTLRIYPHALREANAYYSSQKKALLFGYFSAQPANVTIAMPNNLTFTCLSHDIIAHETTHAILDGLYRKYTEDTNRDVLAFHEAFADIVALFQHFTFPDVLKNQIAATRGDLAAQNLLGKLAQEFGTAMGSYGALRDAIGYIDPKTKKWKPLEPNGDEYVKTIEPHARGAILVSAIFDAFITLYKNRVADLLRIATGGTGILPQGDIQPDLVNRLAAEASKTAGHVLRMCIRALDYCPPVDITFGDFLRAIITADVDLVADDERDYRIAFIDAFRKRGIYPSGIKNLSVESLAYSKPDSSAFSHMFRILVEFLRDFRADITYETSRAEIYKTTRKYIAGNYDTDDKIKGLHRRLNITFDNSEAIEKITGLVFTSNWEKLGVQTSAAYNVHQPKFQVHSLHVASRVGPSGNQSNQIIITLVQKAQFTVVKNKQGDLEVNPGLNQNGFILTGGCTLIFDLDTLELKYAIAKPLVDSDALSRGIHALNAERAVALYKRRMGSRTESTAYQAYFGLKESSSAGETFAFLHTH
jgi:hypothetical protein